MRQASFRCLTCCAIISNTPLGTKHRSHCPLCLWSKHVDNSPGDRESRCGGRMEPIGLQFKHDGELMIVHQCLACGKISNNRIAGDDIPEIILSLADGKLDEFIAKVRTALYGQV